MTIQVLVAAMNQNDYSLIEKMNLQSDAIIGNQCNRNSVEIFKKNGYEYKYYSFAERGVGLNRNTTLMRATADLCLFADDDMRYVDGYNEILEECFGKYSDADILIFNLIEKNPSRYIIRKPHRVWYHNYLRYGTARIAIKLRSIKTKAIYFNQCFGGGTEYCHGEDNLFLTECLNKGLKIYAIPIFIAELTEERKSSWNNGYDDNYLMDQGILYNSISKRWWKLLCLQDCIRHNKLYKTSVIDSYRIMKQGVHNNR